MENSLHKRSLLETLYTLPHHRVKPHKKIHIDFASKIIDIDNYQITLKPPRIKLNGQTNSRGGNLDYLDELVIHFTKSIFDSELSFMKDYLANKENKLVMYDIDKRIKYSPFVLLYDEIESGKFLFIEDYVILKSLKDLKNSPIIDLKITEKNFVSNSNIEDLLVFLIPENKIAVVNLLDEISRLSKEKYVFMTGDRLSHEIRGSYMSFSILRKRGSKNNLKITVFTGLIDLQNYYLSYFNIEYPF